jgi:hypothetical protein
MLVWDPRALPWAKAGVPRRGQGTIGRAAAFGADAGGGEAMAVVVAGGAEAGPGAAAGEGVEAPGDSGWSQEGNRRDPQRQQHLPLTW